MRIVSFISLLISSFLFWDTHTLPHPPQHHHHSHAQLQRQPSHLSQDEGDLMVQQLSEKIRNGEAIPEALVAGEPKAHEHHGNHRRQERRKHPHRQIKEADDLANSRRGLKFFAASTSSMKRLFKPFRPPAMPSSLIVGASASDQVLRQPPQPNCAWQVRKKGGKHATISLFDLFVPPSLPRSLAPSPQAYITGKQYNVAYPDLQAVYQVLVMLNVNDNNIFRIRGTFPQQGVRYFSLQSNNVNVGFPISTIKDYEVEVDDPSKTRNPFAEDSARPIGTYTIHVTPRGNQGLKNELALCAESMSDFECNSVNAVMLMRFYTSDPERPPVNSKTDPVASQKNPRLFGYAPAPVVEERRFKSWGSNRAADKYSVFPTCDQTRSTQVTALITKHFSSMIPPFADPVRHNKNDNFVLYLGEETASAGVYPNLDAAYLLAVAWQKSADLSAEPKKRLVARITGTLPVTARNLFTDPKIANWKEADVRYASFSSIALVATGPTCDTLDDAAFLRFYEPKQAEGEVWNRSFSFVAAEDPGRTCGLFNATEELFLSTSLDGKPQDYWGVLDRQLLPTTQRTRLPDRSNGYARLQCAEAAETDACVDPDYLKTLMGEYYPSIKWYTCDDKGVLKEVKEYLGLVPVSETKTNKQQVSNGGIGSN